MGCKLIIFDLDGVLVDARELHYHALNDALMQIDKKFIVNRDEHLSTYDGRPTSKKLKLLTENKGLDPKFYDRIWKLKQHATIKHIDKMDHDERMRNLLKRLKDRGFILYCASNSIRKTVMQMLLRRGLLEYFDGFLSNEDVNNPKPHPEIYFQCMIQTNTTPADTLVIEDSHIGRRAASASGAKLCAVRDPGDVTYEKINHFISKMDNINKISPKWQGGNMNVLIPMAGAGSRFEKTGYTFPKPLIDVNGKPMIQVVVENLNIDATHIFIVQKSHYEQYNLSYLLNLISPNCKIVQVDCITEGAACTTLLANEYINNDEPLVIVNSDQVFEWDSNEFMYSMVADDVDGGILTFTATHPKWSFAKLGEDGFVEEVAEKKPISDIATAGVYYWKKGSDYVESAGQMIEKDIRTNNEFYVCPIYNEAILNGKKIKVFHIDKMWGLGTPEDLQHYLVNHPKT